MLGSIKRIRILRSKGDEMMDKYEYMLDMFKNNWRNNGIDENKITEKIDKIRANVISPIERRVTTMFFCDGCQTDTIAAEMDMPRNEVVDMIRNVTKL